MTGFALLDVVPDVVPLGSLQSLRLVKCAARQEGLELIAVVLGTVAELIKMAPVLRRLQERGSTSEIWFTAMHLEGFADLKNRLVPDVPMRWLADPRRQRDVGRVADVPAWLLEISRSYRAQKDQLSAVLARDGLKPMVMVHGDTFTTVVGALWGKGLSATVAHVEAGYRSGSLLAPFPEEIDRRLAARLVDIHFAPSQREVGNLRKADGLVVDTRGNTVIDALRMFMSGRTAGPGPEPYGVVTLHRFEFMRRPQEVAEILALCKEASQRTPIRFITGPHGRERLEQHNLLSFFDDHLKIIDRMSYPDFVPVLAGAAFVLTDSGGLQQECAYLGTPCLIHRDRTESELGLGANVVLSRMSLEVVRSFLDNPEGFRAPSTLDSSRPSDVIIGTLGELGYVE